MSRAARSISFRVLLRLCDDHGVFLAEEFYWHNPAKLPSPIEWVNKRKDQSQGLGQHGVVAFQIRVSEGEREQRAPPPYSERMKKLIEDPDGFYKPKERPLGDDISSRFGKDNGGAISSNLLQFSNTESNSIHIRLCKAHDIPPHPARFPGAAPEFFIKFLTEPGDTVVDIFAGSNTHRRSCRGSWVAELDRGRVRFGLRGRIRVSIHARLVRRRRRPVRIPVPIRRWSGKPPASEAAAALGN